MRVTAQLIDVQSGYNLFSRTFQREFKGVFELQDELAQAVVDEIVPRSGADPLPFPKSRAPKYGNAGRDEDAFHQHALGLEVNPLFPLVIASGAVVQEWTGNLDAAIEGYKKACELSANRPAMVSFLAHALAVAGTQPRPNGCSISCCNCLCNRIWTSPVYFWDSATRTKPCAGSREP